MDKKAISGVAIGVLIVLGVLALIFMMIAGIYNSLVMKDAIVEKSWGNVESAYQRRADLIPNLVEVVKGAANFEKSTYLAVTEARTQWLNAQTPTEKIAAGEQMDTALARLLVTVENYPDLKASANFLALQDELSGTENRIKFERDNYNEKVQEYKIATRSFPSNIIANSFGFDLERWKTFEAEPVAEEAPKVNF